MNTFPEKEVLACIRSLITWPAGIGVAAVDENPPPLPEVEQRAVERASAIRQAEFSAGRKAARAALVDLGFDPCPVPRLGNGQPQWPSTVVGSISHTRELAVAIVLSRQVAVSVGIDIETWRSVTENIWAEVLDERELADARGWGDTPRAVAAMFAAKEAFYKFQHPLSGRWLDFKDVFVSLHEKTSATIMVKRPCGLIPKAITARFAFVGDYIAAVVCAPL